VYTHHRIAAAGWATAHLLTSDTLSAKYAVAKAQPIVVAALQGDELQAVWGGGGGDKGRRYIRVFDCAVR
jgi:hypothetical protein